MMPIQYRGSPLPDVIAGQVARPANASARRNPALPDLAAVAEVLPGCEGDGGQGFILPAGTPREIVARMNTEIARILAQTEVQQKLAEFGLQPVDNSIDEFERVSRVDLDKWGKLARPCWSRAPTAANASCSCSR